MPKTVSSSWLSRGEQGSGFGILPTSAVRAGKKFTAPVAKSLLEERREFY
jgi:hypothetical protein